MMHVVHCVAGLDPRFGGLARELPACGCGGWFTPPAALGEMRERGRLYAREFDWNEIESKAAEVYRYRSCVRGHLVAEPPVAADHEVGVVRISAQDRCKARNIRKAALSRAREHPEDICAPLDI